MRVNTPDNLVERRRSVTDHIRHWKTERIPIRGANWDDEGGNPDLYIPRDLLVDCIEDALLVLWDSRELELITDTAKERGYAVVKLSDQDHLWFADKGFYRLVVESSPYPIDTPCLLISQGENELQIFCPDASTETLFCGVVPYREEPQYKDAFYQFAFAHMFLHTDLGRAATTVVGSETEPIAVVRQLEGEELTAFMSAQLQESIYQQTVTTGDARIEHSIREAWYRSRIEERLEGKIPPIN